MSSNCIHFAVVYIPEGLRIAVQRVSPAGRGKAGPVSAQQPLESAPFPAAVQSSSPSFPAHCAPPTHVNSGYPGRRGHTIISACKERVQNVLFHVSPLQLIAEKRDDEKRCKGFTASVRSYSDSCGKWTGTYTTVGNDTMFVHFMGPCVWSGACEQR